MRGWGLVAVLVMAVGAMPVRQSACANPPDATDADSPATDLGRADAEIAQLIDRTENQVAEGRVWSPPGDNALESVRRILELVPDATPETVRDVNALPNRLRERGAIEDAAGRGIEARRFAIFADALGPADGTTPLAARGMVARPASPVPDGAAAPARSDGPAPAPATAPAPPPPAPPAASRAPEPVAPEPVAPELGAPEPVAPEPVAPEPVAPGPVAPQPVASEAVAPEAGAPKPGAPAAPAPPAEPPVAAPPSPAPAQTAETLPPEVIAALMRRGDAMLAVGDISAARLLYERAALAGNAAAATAVGRTHDPATLARLGARGIRGDPDLAARWYRRAVALGDKEAAQRLERLEARETR
jgi:hypothetical protein